jgi:hypothetical protein
MQIKIILLKILVFIISGLPGFIVSVLATLTLDLNDWFILIIAYIIPSVVNGFAFSCGL